MMNFTKLPQLVDMRGELKSKGTYSNVLKQSLTVYGIIHLQKNICPDLMQQVSRITI
ncbi:hypothetical protein [Peribacillus butanolivorans]|uniref:hypothetical protein n=1 Tax=Peribacillus butanolivorans TaxID=421767 RepID=UPI00167F89A0|nr:hypothetical protein [Peribacillus butanolivorans]QNU05429.1 hypothetical protein GM240_16960 [Peribacillus butanolivorans]